jgi:hypothetical protein
MSLLLSGELQRLLLRVRLLLLLLLLETTQSPKSIGSVQDAAAAAAAGVGQQLCAFSGDHLTRRRDRCKGCKPQVFAGNGGGGPRR